MGGGPAGIRSPGFWRRSFFTISRRAASTGAFEPGRFGFNRFGPNRFDRFGSNRLANRFNRFNRFGGNQLLFGGWAGAVGRLPRFRASEPIIAGDGAPVIINIGVDPGPGDAAAPTSGGCVIHKLNYDNTGKYVGERQIPQC